TGSSHQRGERFAVVRDGGPDSLHQEINLVQSGSEDGVTQRLEMPHTQRNVVVDQENGSSAMVMGVANVSQHAVEGISMKITAPHLDDGTEAAIIGAATRSLDYV